MLLNILLLRLPFKRFISTGRQQQQCLEVKQQKALRSNNKRSRRLGYFLLLEVMIAFALVVLVALPLISPHFYIYQQQRSFIDKIELDIVVNQIYVQILEKMYRNEITWADIEQQRVIPIDSRLLQDIGYTKPLPYTGTYRFHIIKRKKNSQYALNRVELALEFTPKGSGKRDNKDIEAKRLTYIYEDFVALLLSAGPGQETP